MSKDKGLVGNAIEISNGQKEVELVIAYFMIPILITFTTCGISNIYGHFYAQDYYIDEIKKMEEKDQMKTLNITSVELMQKIKGDWNEK